MSLDPDLAGALHHLAGAGSITDLLGQPGGLDRLEAFSGGAAPYQAPAVRFRETGARGPNGTVPVRVYGGAPGHDGPALVWLHGGGFAGGTLDMREADQVARELADRTGGLVFSVDYRLAGDGVHFPVPHEDALAAWIWAAAHAEGLGVGPGNAVPWRRQRGRESRRRRRLYLKDAGLATARQAAAGVPVPARRASPSEAGRGVRRQGAFEGLPRILRFTEDDCRAMVENYIGGPVGMASSYALPGHADPSGLPPGGGHRLRIRRPASRRLSSSRESTPRGRHRGDLPAGSGGDARRTSTTRRRWGSCRRGWHSWRRNWSRQSPFND